MRLQSQPLEAMTGRLCDLHKATPQLGRRVTPLMAQEELAAQVSLQRVDTVIDRCAMDAERVGRGTDCAQTRDFGCRLHLNPQSGLVPFAVSARSG